MKEGDSFHGEKSVNSAKVALFFSSSPDSFIVCMSAWKDPKVSFFVSFRSYL
jgi:hypothetical protein